MLSQTNSLPSSNSLSGHQVARHCRVHNLVSEDKPTHRVEHKHRGNHQREVLNPRKLECLQGAWYILDWLVAGDLYVNNELSLVRRSVRLNKVAIIVH